MIKPIFVQGKTLGDTWYQLLWQIYEHGRKYKITNGSFAGTNRLEFDFVSGISMFPHQRPLAPIMPEGSPPSTTDAKIEEYFPAYLMDAKLQPNEEYRYSTWINGRLFNKYLDKDESQLEWVIRHFKGKGYGNNHCYINVGNPDSNLAYDREYKNETDRGTSPCLRGIDFKIKDNQLIMHIIYRSWDLYSGWPENMGGLTLLNEYVASHLEGVEPGPMAFSSAGLHCYDYQLEVLKGLLRKE